MLRLLHTADWHLGKRFPSFPEKAQTDLMRSRLDVVDKILDLALRHRVHAVLCAGDLFDEPSPKPEWWGGLASLLARHTSMPPVFLVPGNHDPLMKESVWAKGHAFRAQVDQLPWVHVVDRDDFSFPLAEGAQLFAAPCRSKAGTNDLALGLPARPPGDTGLRIGCVHGSTFDLPGCATNFPIQREAGVLRGLDYLAIGDTHAFRDVTPDLSVPTVYPGAPDQTAFDEKDTGNVAIVALYAHGRRPTVRAERVAYWRWHEAICRSIEDLQAVLAIPDLERHVLRLKLDFAVSVAEESEVERILTELTGTAAAHPRAGVVTVDRTRLRLVAATAEAFDGDLPPVLQDTVARLRRLAEVAEGEAERATAGRALAHLYKLLQEVDQAAGEAS